ncbi:microcephalin isoform X1 [Arapaima gigas]
MCDDPSCSGNVFLIRFGSCRRVFEIRREMVSNSTSANALKDVVAFVDVWSSSRTENYSRPFIRQLQDMGAEISKTFNKQVTHVVFNHGKQSTWDKAKKLGVKLVSVLWVDSCKASGQHVDEESYPAVHEESKVHQAVKKRTHRCLQPRDVLAKTPENDKRMKRKLDQMMKDLVPSPPISVSDTSPFIIDEESAIVYSPLSRRANAMALRLKEMKEQRENLSPTASQVAASQCSFEKLVVDLPAYDSVQPEEGESSCNLSFDELHTAGDKKQGKHDIFKKASHAALGSSKTDMERNNTEASMNLPHNTDPKKTVYNKNQVKKKTPKESIYTDTSSVESKGTHSAAEVKSDSKLPAKGKTGRRRPSVPVFNLNISGSQISESTVEGSSHCYPISDTSSLGSNRSKSRRSVAVPTWQSPKDVNAEGNIHNGQKKLMPDKKSAVNICGQFGVSLDASASSGNLTNRKTEMVKEPQASTPDQELQLSWQKRKPSVVLDLGTVNKSLNVSTPDDSTVFEDYFSPANQQDQRRLQRPLSVSLSSESDPLPHFNVEPMPRKRRRVDSEDTLEDKNSRHEVSSGKKHNVDSWSSGVFNSFPQGAAVMDVRQTREQANAPDGDSLHRNKRGTTDGHDLHSSADTLRFKAPVPMLVTDGPHGQDQHGAELLSQDGKEESCLNLKRCKTGYAADVSYTKSEMSSKQKRRQKEGAFKVNRKKAKRTLVMTSMSSEKRHTVLQLVDTLGGFSVIDTVCETTTHVVTGSPRRTLNILLGIARGCWILSFEWILWCLEHRQWIPEEPYELADDFPAAPICRLQQHLSAGEHQQDLFSSQPTMFVSPQSQPPAAHLSELIQLCGGTVCKSVRQASICIGEYRGKKPEGARSLSEQWVLDCLTHLKQLPYENYDLEWKS